MTPKQREEVIHYICCCRAEDAVATFGVSLPYAYALFRKVPEPWHPQGLEALSDQELLAFYVDHFDVDPNEHSMDHLVTGLVLEAAFSGR